MARPIGELARLGAHVASVMDEHTDLRARALESARKGFLERDPGASSVRARLSAMRWVWAMGVAGALAAVAVIMLNRSQIAVGFEVDGAPGVTRSWLAAPPEAALRLVFSEGTRVRIEAAARARVTELDEHGASLTLESGSLHAEVVHRSDSAWKVVAGPFSVRVTGTVFDVRWDPTSQQLTVEVSRGSVSVRDASGVEQAVKASQTLHASAFEHRSTIAPSAEAPGEPVVAEERAAPAIAADSAAEPRATEARDPASDASAKTARPPLEKAGVGQDAWRAFARRGALREAFASAMVAGFTDTCTAASPSELLLLGDGARLSGNPARAEEALLTLRRRYPADGRRAAAAFALGKVAFDQRSAYEQAAAWFSTSLREQPTGPLARDAAGRLIEALRRADDSAGARPAAREYLEKYPEGPHADLARSVLR